MPTIPERLETATALAEVDSGLLHDIVHGPASGEGSDVETDNGPVPTVAKAVAAIAGEGPAILAANNRFTGYNKFVGLPDQQFNFDFGDDADNEIVNVNLKGSVQNFILFGSDYWFKHEVGYAITFLRSGDGGSPIFKHSLDTGLFEFMVPVAAEQGFKYTPANESDWAGAAPTTVQQALDRLAAATPGA